MLCYVWCVYLCSKRTFQGVSEAASPQFARTLEIWVGICGTSKEQHGQDMG